MNTTEKAMTNILDRRRTIQLALAALPALLSLRNDNARAAVTVAPGAATSGAQHDFDYFLGSWKVHHRKLKKRLVGSHEWVEFDGTTTCQSLLGGIANMNDSVVNSAGGPYRGLGLRAFDAKTNTWADWYLDGRDPSAIDAPGIGRFNNGVGTFLSDDIFEGRPIKVRGIFSSQSGVLAQWEQAYSADDGKTWETNWVMRHVRIG
jgi:hypothetical protein